MAEEIDFDEFNFEDFDIDNFDIDEISVDIDKNPYLDDSNKGLELISKLLSKNNNSDKKRKIHKLDNLLDRKLLSAVSEMKVSNELKYYEKLNNLSDKLFEQNKVQLLNYKTVVGVGGKFSAGKSKFINAILADDILPEDQNPTTSIPTYIVNSNEDSIRAYTFNNQDIELDLQAAQAITHAFYEKYKLGFSQFINNLVIKSSSIDYKNLAILDTPGYTKYDSNKKKTVSDEIKAFEQLKTVDFLIWLVDIENGVLQEKDIEFIRSLKLENPILIVFNKADKKSEDIIRNIVENTIKVLNNTDIKCYGVTVYSSYFNEEYLDKNLIKEFLTMADNYKRGKENITVQIKDITRSLENELSIIGNKAIEERNFLGNIIFRSEDVLEIKALTNIYSEAMDKVNDINSCERKFKHIKSNINEMLRDIVR